jgi:hypothetical protein
MQEDSSTRQLKIMDREALIAAFKNKKLVFEPGAFWMTTPRGLYFVTDAYLKGSIDAQKSLPPRNPFPPGPKLAQYNYGYQNEIRGFHDDYDLPFDRIQ